MIIIVTPTHYGGIVNKKRVESFANQTANFNMLNISSERTENIEVGVCRNLEIAKNYIPEKTEFIVVADSDVYFPTGAETAISDCVEFLEKNKDVDGVALDTKNLTDEQIKSHVNIGHVNAAFVVLKKDVFKRINFNYKNEKTGAMRCHCYSINEQARVVYHPNGMRLDEIK